MKKYIILLIIVSALSISLTLTACQGTQGGSDSTTTPEPSDSVSESLDASSEDTSVTTEKTKETSESSSSASNTSSTEASASEESSSSGSSASATSSSASDKWTETAFESVMYVLADNAKSYKTPDEHGEKANSYKKNTKVKVVAKTDNGFYKLSTDDYIKMIYLGPKPVDGDPIITIATTPPPVER